MTHDLPDPAPVSRLAVHTADGLALRAEIAEPPEVTAAAVVCHPHPLHGGSMYANVVEALFDRLPAFGAAVLRFNFRGVSGSEGRFAGGRGERLDAEAAVGELHRRWPSRPLLLAGYSFGAVTALAVDHPAIAGWLAVAPPLTSSDPAELTALADPRPKTFVVGVHDQFCPHDDLVRRLADYPNCRVTKVDGCDHFFAVGLDTVVAAATDALMRR